MAYEGNDDDNDSPSLYSIAGLSCKDLNLVKLENVFHKIAIG